MKIRAIFICIISLFAMIHFVEAAIPPVERAALIALYNSTGGDNWLNNNGWKTPPLHTDGFAMPGTEGSWYGVFVDHDNSFVIHLRLEENQLSGSISPQLGDLSNLHSLGLYGNQLTGNIPSQLGNLTKLEALWLFSNNLTGNIPSQLGNLTELRVFWLSDNQLTGNIPPQLGNFTKLESYFFLGGNQLTGTVPSELGNFTSLKWLDISNNQLTGNIPPELGNLTSLEILGLSGNQLSGEIPAALGNLSHLQGLGLGNNQLTGEIPAALGNLLHLQEGLNIAHNQLTGNIPHQLGNLSHLQTLHINNNFLSGTVPPNITALTALLDNASDVRHNHLYSDNQTVIDFLNQKQAGGNWQSFQTLFQPFSDTGQTRCYNNTTEITCPQPGQPFFGQDAQYQPRLPRSYTKLGMNGVELPVDAAHVDNGGQWVMTRDNVTGLIWEVKTNANREDQYNWDEAQDVFITGLNAYNFSGFNDWRLPEVWELASLFNSGAFGPAVDVAWFPNTRLDSYWSSSTDAYNSNYAWHVAFYNGYIDYYFKMDSHYVRAVRSGQSWSFDNVIVNGDGTVTDPDTGLMWQEETPSDTYTWQEALAYTENLTLGGYSDWRMPNRHELQSLINYSRHSPAVTSALVEKTVSSSYWSSSTNAHNSSYAWIVGFDYGYVSDNTKSDSYRIRAVRAGQTFDNADNFYISVSAQPPDGGSVSGGGVYNRDEEISVRANAQDGYAFANWTEYSGGNVDVVSESANYTFEVRRSRNLVANFDETGYYISVSADPPDGGWVSGGGTYSKGEEVTVEANARDGYAFVNWTEYSGGNVDVVSDSANYTFEARRSRNLMANFEETAFYISVSAHPPDGGSVSGGGTYNRGQEISVWANARTGYAFANWTEYSGGNIDVVSDSANYTFEVRRSRNLMANFEAVQVQHTVSASAGTGGSVTPSSRTVGHGSTTTFVVTPHTSYQHGDVGGTCPEGSFNANTYTTGAITGNCTVIFSFFQLTFPVTASAEAGGSVTPDERNVPSGDRATFTVTPDSGYTHDVPPRGTCPTGSFSGNRYTTGPIAAGCNIIFSFIHHQQEHTVTATAGSGGSVTPGSRTVGHGSTASFTVMPGTGYTRGETGGTCPAGTFSGDTYTTGAVTADCSVTFSFVQMHRISASAGTGGSVSPTVQSVPHGTAGTFTVTPDSGFGHGIISGNCPAGSFSGNTYTTGAVTQDCDIAFSFRPVQHTVEASAGSGGSVSPTSQTVGHGGTAVFTVTRDMGFVFGNVSGSCPPGAFSGTTYTTGTITSSCAVHFNFTRQQHAVTASAGSGGSVDHTLREVGHGGTAAFTVTPQAGFSHGLVGGTCSRGTFNGNTYTTGAITANCAVQFNFTQTQHDVTASAGTGGSVLPTSLKVGHGGTATFSVTPHAGLAHGPVGGTCPAGSFSGTTYTTGAITEQCAVHFSFTQTQHTVTATAGTGGRVDPTSRTAGHGAPATFTVMPNTGYAHGPVSSTCSAGNFNGNTYTTGAITAPCNVQFSFTQAQHDVTATAGSGGRVSPTSLRAGHGTPATFTVIPDTDHTHGPVSGSCPPGAFSGTTYTTGNITGTCTVSFSFRPKTEHPKVGLPGVLMLLLGE